MSPTWLSPAEQRAWRAYRRMVLLVDAAIARDLARDTALSVPDYQVLSTLSEADDRRRRMSELCLRMQWSPSRLSHHVTRMEQRGLVRRSECDVDLRAAYVELTDAGWAAIEDAAPGHVQSVRANLVDLLTPAELETLTAIGEKVARRFGENCLDHPAAEETPEASEPSKPPLTPGQSSNRMPVSRS